MDELPADLAARLDRLESNQEDIIGHQRDISDKLTEMNGTLRDVVVEIGGAPVALGRDLGRRSIRMRLHDLEEMQNAANAAGAALGLLFGRLTRWAILVGIVIAAAGTMLRLFGVGG